MLQGMHPRPMQHKHIILSQSSMPLLQQPALSLQPVLHPQAIAFQMAQGA
jgi:hypothetical protein